MKSLKSFGIAIGALFFSIFIHFSLMQWGLKIEKPYFFSIYIFVTVILIVSSFVVQILEKRFKEYLGYFFLIIVAAKLLAGKVFIDSFAEKDENLFKITLITLYMISLAMITWFVAQKLLKPEN